MVTAISLPAQDSIRYRVILIGDAGEMNKEQQKALTHAANHIITGKTSVVYLGDNVYPVGMGLPGSKEEKTTEEILQSQYQPMRAKGAPVYFVPGNHDWDKSGVHGLEKIKQQSQYLQSRGDSLLQLVPANGCPDPVEIKLSDSLILIAYDSEWWLFPFNKTNTEGDCACKTKEDVLAKLEEIKNRNKDNIILLASHHPFQSYGTHGGIYSLKDHIFPLTNVNKKLYIPLPVIGSLYPLLRTVFTNPEDQAHPLYKDMIKRIDKVFEGFPNMVHVAGHEHGLQFIKGKQVQVVSGAGAKHTVAKKGKNSLFADATQGYVTADLLVGNSLRFTYYIYADNNIQQAFTYLLPYTIVQQENDFTNQPIKEDSVVVRVHPSYDKPGKFHRLFFGENYRKEWAAPTKLPVIRISEINGGLTPTQLGGGFQSKSLRLKDKDGKEWVIRSVEKTPDKLLPDALRETFARDWVDDVTSAQHPFSALVVPPIANAVKVPHANPVIGILSPDKNLGMYSKEFANLVVLLEEREPLGESDNSEKMKKNLQKDNDNSLQPKELLRARMLDMFIGDWDRHEDQWRWYDDDKGKEISYVAVPRDRDQVFRVSRGLIPAIASLDFVLPELTNFDAGIRRSKRSVYKTRFVNAYPSFQISREDWTKQAEKFKQALTDSVLETALQRLPASAYALRHDVLLHKLQMRRERLPAAMDEYYRFIQKVVDIETSDKNELVRIDSAPDGGLTISIHKLSKEREVKDELMNKTYDAALTKEIRLYIRKGHDSVVINNPTSNIKLRIIGGGKDEKTYHVTAAKNKIELYDKPNGSYFTGDSTRLKKHISADSLNTAFTPVNLYNIWMPLITMGLNLDDGFIFGGGFSFTKQQGFRKYPYVSKHQLMISHSFSTTAFRFRYNASWIKVLGNADITLQALAKAPDNTINFFGRGNETVFDKTGDFKRYYRTRFSTYQLDPAFRWNKGKNASLSIGPSFYYYRFDRDDNDGRFINNISQIGSYDSATIGKDKMHLGVAMQYVNDKRSNKILPKWGSYINIKLQAYKGMGSYARSFAQLIPEIAVYKALNARSSVILANRIGGTVGIGESAFYQSAFIGGQENLLGYRQYRFAGQHSFYNNLELRIKLADVASYIAPGQFGITGFWDIGRVWQKNDNSGKWHNGTGGGIYFAPASMFAFNFVMGYSGEGWYPYFTMGLRF